MKSISIREKLIFYFVLIGIIAILTIGSYSYFYAKTALLNRTFDQLISLRLEKKNRIEQFFLDRVRDINLISKSEEIKNITDILYSEEKSVEEINKLQLNSSLSNYISAYGYYQQLHIVGQNNFEVNINPSGNDQNSNIDIKTISDNDLKIFCKKIGLVKKTTVQDLTKSKLLIYIGTPVFNEAKNIIGFIVLEIPIAAINNIMFGYSENNGLGKTGETYLVGDDFLMRSDSRFIPNSVLNIEVKTISAINAFKDKIGSSLIDDYRTVSCLSSYDRISVSGLNWAIIAEIDYDEAMIPIVSLRNDIVFLSLVICVLLLSIAQFISRTITNPIIKLKNAALMIGEGNLNININPKSNDEIGLLTEAFNTMTMQLKDERLKRMSALYDGQEMERQRISRELHDGLGQKLIAIKLQLESTSKQNADETKTTIDEVKVDFLKIIDEVRQISNNLAPNILNESGIDVSLKNLCDSINRTTKIDIELSVFGDYSTNDPKVKFYIYRIAQEALNNAIKHSGATKIQIQLLGNTDSIILVLEDNGKGFVYDSNFYTPCNGIYNMKERARLLNGTLDIETEPFSGTTIRLKIPKQHSQGKNNQSGS